MCDSRPVQGLLLNRGELQPKLTLFEVQRSGDTDSPILSPFFSQHLPINRFKLTVRVTQDPFEDGKVSFNNLEEAWDLWLWHPMPLDMGEERYAVYFNRTSRVPESTGTSSLSTRSDIAVFRQALNRPGLTLMSIKLREDKFGLYGVF